MSYIPVTASGLTVSTKSYYMRTILYDNTLGSAGTWDVSSLDQSYDHLEVILQVEDNTNNRDFVSLYFNNDTTAGNYKSVRWYGGTDATTATTITDAVVGILPNTTNSRSITIAILIQDYALTTFKKVAAVLSMDVGNNLANFNGYHAVLEWNSTAAINRITVRGNTGGGGTSNFATGSRLQIIGIKAETVVTNVT
jgi:hypothetical protein